MIPRWKIDLLLNGLKISYRGRSLKKQWSNHLKHTREFLNKSLTGDAEDLHVFGAGRLLDFPLSEIKEKYQSVFLYDADPGSIKFLKSAARKSSGINVVQVELTGSLGDFQKNLLNSELAKIILVDPKTMLKKLNISKNSDIISLNLLSQLPLAYRQIFERWIIKSKGMSFYKSNEDTWLKEYLNLGERVVKQHLDLLNLSTAKKVLLVSDTEQLFCPRNLAPTPTPNSDFYSWNISPAVIQPLEVTSSICGVDYRGKENEYFPNYKLANREFWKWELDPVKKNQDGIICRVDAIKLDRIKISLA